MFARYYLTRNPTESQTLLNINLTIEKYLSIIFKVFVILHKKIVVKTTYNFLLTYKSTVVVTNASYNSKHFNENVIQYYNFVELQRFFVNVQNNLLLQQRIILLSIHLFHYILTKISVIFCLL